MRTSVPVDRIIYCHIPGRRKANTVFHFMTVSFITVSFITVSIGGKPFMPGSTDPIMNDPESRVLMPPRPGYMAKRMSWRRGHVFSASCFITDQWDLMSRIKTFVEREGSYLAQQHEYQHDHQDQADGATREVAPIAAVGPSREGSKQQE